MEPAVHTLRKQRWRHAPGKSPGVDDQPREGDGERQLVCARCDRPITDSSCKREKNGLFEHSQVNPHGFIWRFGCFSAAPGVVPSGRRQTQFSWFAGMTWQLAHCGQCTLHLGWIFESPDERFYALILERLAERGTGDP